LLRLHTPKGTELVSDHDDTTTVLETVRTTVDCPETDDGQKGLRAHELASIPFARSTAADVTGKIISRLTGAMLAFSGIAILVWVVWAGASIITGYFFESSAVRTDPAPSTSVAAMEVQSAQAGLVVPVFEARSIRCEWGRGTQADWDGGKLSLEQGTFGRDASLTFDSIDIEKRTARILGNAGASDVVVIPTPVGLTFFEQTALGGVNVTTVFASGVGANKQLVGVTSRHLSTFGGPFPSQWHGPCRIFN
jgi:hypothetical protein